MISPRTSMNSMSSGMSVFFIHMRITPGRCSGNSMPRPAASERTNISPCSERCGVSAIQISKCWRPVCVWISSGECGKAFRLASASPAGASPAASSSATANKNRACACPRRAAADRSGPDGWQVIGGILFHDGTGKIKPAQQQSCLTGQRRGGSNTEATGGDAVQVPVRLGRPRLLGQLVDGAFAVARGGEQFVLAFENHRDVRRYVMRAACAGCGGDAEYEPQVVRPAFRRPGKSQAHALLTGARTTIALHVRITPVDIQIAVATQ